MLTAKNLLYKALDFDGFWNSSKRMRESEPSKARKLQLDPLLHAFQISKKNAKNTSQIQSISNNRNVVSIAFYSTSKNRKSLERLDYIKTLNDFQYLTSGEFLADREREIYQDILARVVSVVTKVFPHETEIPEQKKINLVSLFRNLYSFRHIAFCTFESSFLRMNRIQDFQIEEAYCNLIKQGFIKTISKNFAEIDELLCLLIDPENKSFSEAEINYPEFDLDLIDLNWQKSLRK